MYIRTRDPVNPGSGIQDGKCQIWDSEPRIRNTTWNSGLKICVVDPDPVESCCSVRSGLDLFNFM
jgi:hypothetical protein